MPEPHIVKAIAKIYDLQDPTAEDEQVGDEPERASSSCWTTRRSSAKRIKSAVTDAEREIRFDPARQARASPTC